jgi:hypothetical protein
MNGSTARRVAAGMAVALFVVASAAAVPPEAKNASNSVRVDPPERLVAYFESNGVNMSRFRTSGTVDDATAEAMYALYVAEDGQGDRVHSGRINGIVLGALTTTYNEVQAPVYMEFGSLYWGSWREQDGLSDD